MSRPIILIMLENASYSDVIRDPAHKEMINLSTINFTNYHGTDHPSQPNYIQLIAGDNLGIVDNNFYIIPKGPRTLVHLLEDRGISWAGYIEDHPGSNFKGAEKGLYARKHDPFMAFDEIRTRWGDKILNANQNIRGKTRFQRDAEEGRLPLFSFYTPNMDNDGHDTDIETGGNHALELVRIAMNSPQKPIIIITYDEDMPYTENNHIFCVVIDPLSEVSYDEKNRYDHHSLLRTIEEYFGLGTLGRGDSKAKPMFK